MRDDVEYFDGLSYRVFDLSAELEQERGRKEQYSDRAVRFAENLTDDYGGHPRTKHRRTWLFLEW